MLNKKGFINLILLVILGVVVSVGVIGGFRFLKQEIKASLGAPPQLFLVGTSTITTTFANGLATTTIQPASTTFGGTVTTIGLNTLLGGLNSSSTATTTFAAGIRLDAGCIAVGSTCVGSGVGVSSNWNKQLNFGVLNLTPTTTIPIWAKDAIYGSSTLTVNGSVTLATTTVLGSLNIGTLTATSGTSFISTLSLGNVLTVANGGSGAGTFTSNGLLIGNGTSAFTALTLGTPGQVLAVSGGAPAWVATTTFSTGLTYSLGAVTCDTATASVFGCLPAANWTIFNNKISSTSINAWYPFTPTLQNSLITSGTSTAISTTLGFYASSTSMLSTTTILGTLNLGTLFATSGTSYINALSNLNVTASSTLQGSLMVQGAATTSDLYVAGTFAIPIASTTGPGVYHSIVWGGATTSQVRFVLSGNTSIEMNSTSSKPVDGGKYITKFCQDATGSRTLTWINPVGLRWGTDGTTTISSTADSCSYIGFIYDGLYKKYDAVASSTGFLDR